MSKIVVKVMNPEDEDKKFELVDVDNAGGVVYKYNGAMFTGIIEHYVNGKLLGEEEFTDGHVGGLQRQYYENGQLKEEYYQYFGRMDKHYKFWDEAGNLLMHGIYDDGELVKRVK